MSASDDTQSPGGLRDPGALAVMSGMTVLLVALLSEKAIKKDRLLKFIETGIRTLEGKGRSSKDPMVAVLSAMRDTVANFPEDDAA